MTQEPLFKEEQRFTQWYIWLLLLGILALPVYGIIQQLFLDVPFGTKPMSDTGLIIFFMGVLAFCYFFWMMRLQTTITEHDIEIRFIPFVRKRIAWSDVEQATVIKYGFVGYGIRIWTPYGTVYNVSGNKGLSLLLKNGKKLVVGTQRSHEMEDVVNAIHKNHVTK
jgi:hypothetical protein